LEEEMVRLNVGMERAMVVQLEMGSGRKRVGDEEAAVLRSFLGTGVEGR
jgi:hypothetical protein